MTSKAFIQFVRATQPSFYALVLKNNVIVRLLHWPAVPYMRNSIAQGRFGAIIQLQPLPWDDSTAIILRIAFGEGARGLG